MDAPIRISCSCPGLNYSIALGHLKAYLSEKEGVKWLQDLDIGLLDRISMDFDILR